MNTHEPLPAGLAGRRSRLTAAGGVVLAVGLLIGACSPGASSVPSIPSVAIPSVDVSAAASVAADAAITALGAVDTAITANQSAAGLTADDVAALTQLTAGIKSALQTGDTAAARTAVDNLSTKVDEFAAKLNTAEGAQLKAAITALKAALSAS
jgi:hypothetical protein